MICSEEYKQNSWDKDNKETYEHKEYASYVYGDIIQNMNQEHEHALLKKISAPL